MEFILNIHTATKEAIIAISDGNCLVDFLSNNDAKAHASFVHIAIQDLMKKHHLSFSEMKGVGVSSGPGSYTGIRVALATAKGIAYAADVPLITCNTLEVMALTIKDTLKVSNLDKEIRYCPMIDARRMEVFTGVYDTTLQEVISPKAVDFAIMPPEMWDKDKFWFFSGDGCEKLRSILNGDNYSFYPEIMVTAEALTKKINQKYVEKSFDDLIAAEAIYLKEFFFNPKN